MIFELDPVFSIFQRNGDHGSGYRIRLDRLAVSPGHPAVSPGHQKAEAVSSPSFQAAGDMSVLHFYVGDFSGLDPLRCLLEFLQIQTVKLVIFKSQAQSGSVPLPPGPVPARSDSVRLHSAPGCPGP